MTTDTAQTVFPTLVQQHIGAGFVLVAKNMYDFSIFEPDMATAQQHVEWFHNFWWVENESTRTKMISFYDTKEEALRAGEDFAMKNDVYNWAVYGSDRRLVDGKF